LTSSSTFALATMRLAYFEALLKQLLESAMEARDVTRRLVCAAAALWRADMHLQ
jgi:hypothetical protein